MSTTFLDLFSGAGGLSLGLQQAGWQHLLAVEHWSDAVRTYDHNFGPGSAWQTEVSGVTAASLAARMADKPDWIVGGPPCQGFSTIGKRERHDPRNQLFLEFQRIVGAVRPRGFVLENVLGLKDMRFAHEVRAAFSQIGYHTSFMVLRAADFGVPQLRRRVVFVGTTEQKTFLGPKSLGLEDDWTTVAQAIGDLPPLGPGETATAYASEPQNDYQREMRIGSAELQGHTSANHPAHLVKAISFIPDGGNRQSIPDEFQPKSGFHNSYSRLYSGAPAVAITSNMSKPSASRCIHPFQDRGLTAREGARLQSFPDTFHFQGGHVSQRLQIGNAVPPLLGRALGLALADVDRWADGEPSIGIAGAQDTLPMASGF